MTGKFLGFLALTGAIANKWGLKGLATYTIGAYIVDVPIRRKIAANNAQAYCDRIGKPLLNVGAGGGSFWTSIHGPMLYGDVNMDISADRETPCMPNTLCYGDAHDLSRYPDKHFGAVLATHILEHLENPKQAVNEWNRVADRIYIVVPKWWAPHTWIYYQHYWYVDGNKAYSLWRKEGE